MTKRAKKRVMERAKKEIGSDSDANQLDQEVFIADQSDQQVFALSSDHDEQLNEKQLLSEKIPASRWLANRRIDAFCENYIFHNIPVDLHPLCGPANCLQWNALDPYQMAHVKECLIP